MALVRYPVGDYERWGTTYDSARIWRKTSGYPGNFPHGGGHKSVAAYRMLADVLRHTGWSFTASIRWN